MIAVQDLSLFMDLLEIIFDVGLKDFVRFDVACLG